MRPRLLPGLPAPRLTFETLGHGSYDLSERAPPGGTFLAFHRGRHCKISRNALKELDDRIGDFAIRNIRIVALSGEDRETTARLQEEMQIVRLPLGHSLDIEKAAADWDLFLTRSSTEPEAPPLHWEPAQFWITASGTIGFIARQSAPALSSDVTATLRALDQTVKFPERGTG